jgi:hypothetical protein
MGDTGFDGTGVMLDGGVPGDPHRHSNAETVTRWPLRPLESLYTPTDRIAIESRRHG